MSERQVLDKSEYLVHSVRYTVRQTLGQYEHEEISVELGGRPESETTAEQLLQEARSTALSQTTREKKRKILEKK